MLEQPRWKDWHSRWEIAEKASNEIQWQNYSMAQSALYGLFPPLVLGPTESAIIVLLHELLATTVAIIQCEMD